MINSHRCQFIEFTCFPFSQSKLVFPQKFFDEFYCSGIHTGSTIEAEKIEKLRRNLEEVPHLSGSPEQSQKFSDRYNLRKSLAWDSAFLTDEGEFYYQLWPLFY